MRVLQDPKKSKKSESSSKSEEKRSHAKKENDSALVIDDGGKEKNTAGTSKSEFSLRDIHKQASHSIYIYKIYLNLYIQLFTLWAYLQLRTYLQIRAYFQWTYLHSGATRMTS